MDYAASSGTLSIANSTTGTISIPIVGDDAVEPGENFTVTLASPSAGSIVQAVSTITVLDDDVAPPSLLTIAPITVVEGTSASPTTANVPIAISPASLGPVTVAYTISAGTASAGSDFVATSGSISIAAGATTASVPISIVADAVNEPNETLVVTLGAVTGNATLGATTAVDVTIADDDAVAPTASLSVSDVSILESSSGNRTAQVRVSLGAAHASSTTFTWRTSNGTAVAPGDYAAIAPRTSTIPAGATSVLVNVSVRGDTIDEQNETFDVTISAPTAGVGLADPIGKVTIVDDDPRPTLTIADASVVEGSARDARPEVHHHPLHAHRRHRVGPLGHERRHREPIEQRLPG